MSKVDSSLEVDDDTHSADLMSTWTSVTDEDIDDDQHSGQENAREQGQKEGEKKQQSQSTVPALYKSRDEHRAELTKKICSGDNEGKVYIARASFFRSRVDDYLGEYTLPPGVVLIALAGTTEASIEHTASFIDEMFSVKSYRYGAAAIDVAKTLLHLESLNTAVHLAIGKGYLRMQQILSMSVSPKIHVYDALAMIREQYTAANEEKAHWLLTHVDASNEEAVRVLASKGVKLVFVYDKGARATERSKLVDNLPERQLWQIVDYDGSEESRARKTSLHRQLYERFIEYGVFPYRATRRFVKHWALTTIVLFVLIAAMRQFSTGRFF